MNLKFESIDENIKVREMKGLNPNRVEDFVMLQRKHQFMLDV